MKTLAYINGEITMEKIQELLKQKATQILINIPEETKEGDVVAKSLEQMLMMLDVGDQLIVSDLSSLNRTLAELALFFKKIQEKNISLIILNKEKVFSSLTDYEFINFIMDIHLENQQVIQERTKIAQKTAKNVGRPQLAQETIDRIRYLRLNKKHSISETAKMCDVSVGTVYKYADHQ